MDPHTYKQLKEAFVCNLSGTTMGEISVLSAIFPAFLLIRKWIQVPFKAGSKFSCQSWIRRFEDLTLDSIFVIVPTVSVVTILSDRVYLIMAFVSCTLSIGFLRARKRSENFKVTNDKENDGKMLRLQFISSYRFVVMLVTCLCILAVDFNIFPRRYAKTETYGTGLMDVGVGSFIVANAVVSRQARGISRRKESLNMYRTVLPLLLMGFARLCFIEEANYQVHVGEYGVHWNFFFTLAAVASLTNLVPIPPHLCGIIGAFILFVYQILLLCGLNEYLNSNERGANILSKNKEGIFSLCGYWGLYLVSVHLGYYIFKSTNMIKEKNKSSQKHASMFSVVSRLWILTAIFWALALLSNFFIERVSRRTCNLSYAMFTIAVNLEGLGVLALAEFVPGVGQLIVEDIFTENMLATFLLANVLTGLVNLNMDTLSASGLLAYSILIVYMLVLVAGMGLLKALGIKLKI